MTDLYDDTRHSVRHDLWGALNGDLTVDGAMNRAAALRKDLNEWRKQGHRLAERILEGAEEAARTGIETRQRLEEDTAAFVAVWNRGRGKPDRVALADVGEAPIGPDSAE